MGLLSNLASSAIKAGVDYASNKYATDKRLEGIDKEHRNALSRMQVEHDNAMTRINTQHENELTRIKETGKYTLGTAGIAGLATIGGAYLKYGNKGDRDNKSKGPRPGKGPENLVTQSKGEQAWQEALRHVNDATSNSVFTKVIPATTYLTTGSALATGIAGLLPLLAI